MGRDLIVLLWRSHENVYTVLVTNHNIYGVVIDWLVSDLSERKGVVLMEGFLEAADLNS